MCSGDSSLLGIPVCYVHEAYCSLIYLPYLRISQQHSPQIKYASIPDSGRPRSSMINVQNSSQGNHRQKSWSKVEKKLQEDILWVDNVYFEKDAFNAPKNWFKVAPKRTLDGRYLFWIYLYENEDKKIAVAMETTVSTPEQCAKVVHTELANAIVLPKTFASQLQFPDQYFSLFSSRCQCSSLMIPSQTRKAFLHTLKSLNDLMRLIPQANAAIFSRRC